MDQWTPRVGARRELAQLLLQSHADAARAAGLTTADLETLVRSGDQARDADRQQKEELATVAAGRAVRKTTAEEIFVREDALRSRLPAVRGDLLAADAGELAVWLERLSFARYRFREMAPPSAPPGSPPPADNEELRRVRRVAREDIPTRLLGLGAFCQALGKPGREPIVLRLAERGLAAAELSALGADAEALAALGRNVLRGAEATLRETEAASLQRQKWQQVRRMVRGVCQKDPNLSSKFAAC